MRNRQIHRDELVSVYFALETEDCAYITVSAAGKRGGVEAVTEAAYASAAELLAGHKMHIVHERIFGSLECAEAVLKARWHILSLKGIAPSGPVTYVQGRPVWGQGLAGIQLQAVRPQTAQGVAVLEADGVACCRSWERSGARFLIVQGVHGGAPAMATERPAQAEAMFERAAAILRAHGASYADVARTWIYLNDILGWYDDFNRVRNAKYDAFGLMPDVSRGLLQEPLRLPASTGIQGDDLSGAACVMDVLAVLRAPGCQVDLVQMGNVRQADAFRYGSAFSRGACICEPDVTYVQISGTAAIDEQGRSVCPGDARAQVLWTLDTVRALIGQRGAALADICQATVFMKRPSDYDAYRLALADRGVSDMPAVCVLADVCREELLFEMDGTAAISIGPTAAARSRTTEGRRGK